MINVSMAAQKYLLKLLTTQKEGTYIRIFVSNPGTFYAECGMCFYIPDTSCTDDIIIQLDLLSCYINKFDLPFITDAVVDIVINKLDTQLTIQAPNAKKVFNDIECDTSISLEERVKHVLHCRINPQLAQHGGKVSLIRITKDLVAIIQFHGGCNGCSMANYTIKSGIETTLKRIFPELIGVDDETQHEHGTHSYY